MMYQRMGDKLESSRCFRHLPLALAITHFLIVLFVVVATPVDVFKARKNARASGCASMFGWKECGAHRVSSAFKCGIKSNMGGAAAFAIISIFVTVAAFILLLLSTLNAFKRPLVVLILDGVACLTMLISWACVAGAYNQGTCLSLPYGSVSYSYSYAGSFGLMVTAWVFEVLAIVGMLFVPM
ncbi:g-amastin [Leptomonas pyrrhocoris]|uniref:G-amastin n=1 Tax=Leptomonas pyrrhocoris TaxID=157538 RepID=A0A0M9GA31_LEPPY|nr:g-amastin [Leptomonas pyrrhocoris]KPA85829.1 g-amastin [Leptomonas pyrrhocoris]|eukprot:XP_015664268.1 g-amastin [Leptomonas pyrrhocoris]